MALAATGMARSMDCAASAQSATIAAQFAWVSGSVR
jgi:hypothetical protein